MSSLSLYEISKEGQFLELALTESEGELTPEIEARIDALLIAGSDKLEAAQHVCWNFDAAADACKAEAKRLTERAKAFEAHSDRLKSRMVAALDSAFNGKIKTGDGEVRNVGLGGILGPSSSWRSPRCTASSTVAGVLWIRRCAHWSRCASRK